jgi:hypothetical protein
MQWIKKHLLIFGLIIALIVGGVLYGMSGGGASQEPLLTTETVDSGSPSTDTADRELVESLLTLRAISLSGTIFSDPAFKVLQDFGTTIIPEPVGRTNPFAPLPGQSQTSSQSSQGQTAPRR